MTGRDAVQNSLLSVYRWMNRRGLFENPIVRPLFENAYFFYKRFWEDPYAALSRRHPEMFKNGHILDVGANLGYTAEIFARRLTPGFQVFAFEPERENFARLMKLVDRKQLDHLIIPVHAAVGAAPGSARLWLNTSSHADHRIETQTFHGDAKDLLSAEEVPMESIDQFYGKLRMQRESAVSFIKIDVQGYEAEVCRGMSVTLECNPGAVVSLEYCPGMMKQMGFAPDELLTFFRSRGYKLSRLSRAGIPEPIDSDALKKIDAENGYIDVLFKKP
jgi:FkbM family methyltransferase